MLICIHAMSRVVPDQMRKYENDELFRKLKNESQVRYIGAKDKQQCDKSAVLLEDCEKKQLEVAFVGCGITLTLLFKSVIFGKKHNFKTDYVEVHLEENTVRMVSPFIFNGVCVMFRGWLDLDTLEGTGHLEFDHEAARDEEDLIRHRLYFDAIHPNFSDVKYRPDTPEISSVDSLQLHPSIYRFQPQLEFHHGERGLTSGPFSQSTTDEIPFLSPSTSPLDKRLPPPLLPPPLPPPPPQTSSSSSHHMYHWKKNIRQNSEPSRESFHHLPLTAPSIVAPPPLLSIHPGGPPDTSQEALDLSKSSKTFPPKSSDPRGRQTSLDETLNSFDNISLIQQAASSRPGLTPKEKYFREISKDTFTQTSSSDPSITDSHHHRRHNHRQQQQQHTKFQQSSADQVILGKFSESETKKK